MAQNAPRETAGRFSVPHGFSASARYIRGGLKPGFARAVATPR